MEDVIVRIRQELEQKADEKTKEGGERFFKEDIKLHGLRLPSVNRMAKTYYKEIRVRTKQDIFALCEELWRSNYFEEAAIACTWSHAVHKQYQPDDIKIFERWLSEYVTNWATCDSLCNHSVGDLIDMYPVLVGQLKRWATSENRWMRRGTAVSFIVPAKRGRFLEEVFQIADILLLDTDDLVRKGYGWMLKEAAETHQQQVFNYVMSKKAIMPRTSLRYAIEKMPKELKAQAMEK